MEGCAVAWALRLRAPKKGADAEQQQQQHGGEKRARKAGLGWARCCVVVLSVSSRFIGVSRSKAEQGRPPLNQLGTR